MKTTIFSILQLVVIFGYGTLCIAEDITKPKIAIVGGGIGGTSTAYFLRELYRDNAILELYEPKDIGGRLATISIGNREYETGGSIIHSKNKYMLAFAKKYGFKHNVPCDEILGLFDGEKYSYIDSNWKMISLIKLFLRYGIDLFWLNRLNENMINSFEKIYKLQNAGKYFESVEDLLSSMDSNFPSYLHQSFRKMLTNYGLGDRIIDELVTAATRCNYGQSADIQSFVGNAAVAGIGSSLWSIYGGNKRVPEILLNDSGATRLKATVTSISKLENGKYRINSRFTDDDAEHIDDYNAIAIAAPLTKDTISLKFINFTESFDFPGQYERIFVSLVNGKLNPDTLKFKDVGMDIDNILTTNGSLWYNSIGKLSPVDNNPEKDCSSDTSAYSIYKIFSPEPLHEKQLKKIFKEWESVDTINWLAYPHYEASKNGGKFELSSGLYYNNAIENAASAMEMSAVAARNVAFLIFKHLGGNIEEEVFKDEL